MHHRKILLVEGKPHFCIELETGLKKSGCIVTSFTEISAAEAYLKKENFDVYVLDLAVIESALPRLHEELIRRGVEPSRIFLTSSKAEVQEYKACQLTKATLLLKPFTVEFLSEKVMGAITERRRAS